MTLDASVVACSNPNFRPACMLLIPPAEATVFRRAPARLKAGINVAIA
jgi:hypothetical protein